MYQRYWKTKQIILFPEFSHSGRFCWCYLQHVRSENWPSGKTWKWPKQHCFNTSYMDKINRLENCGNEMGCYVRAPRCPSKLNGSLHTKFFVWHRACKDHSEVYIRNRYRQMMFGRIYFSHYTHMHVSVKLLILS